jgi:hypothetical protein
MQKLTKESETAGQQLAVNLEDKAHGCRMEPSENTLHLTIKFPKHCAEASTRGLAPVCGRDQSRQRTSLLLPAAGVRLKTTEQSRQLHVNEASPVSFPRGFHLKSFCGQMNTSVRGAATGGGGGVAAPWKDGPINVAVITAARPKHTCHSESARQDGCCCAPVHMYVVAGGGVPPAGRHRQRLEGAASVPPTLFVRRLQQRLRIAINTKTADDRLFRTPAAWTACRADCRGRCAPHRAPGWLLHEQRNGCSLHPDSSANYTAT